jgi:hypothetical protein
MTYSVDESQNNLPELIKQAEAGHPCEDQSPKRVFGVLGQKQIVIDPDWARPQDDIEAWLAGDV